MRTHLTFADSTYLVHAYADGARVWNAPAHRLAHTHMQVGDVPFDALRGNRHTVEAAEEPQEEEVAATEEETSVVAAAEAAAAAVVAAAAAEADAEAAAAVEREVRASRGAEDSPLAVSLWEDCWSNRLVEGAPEPLADPPPSEPAE